MALHSKIDPGMAIDIGDDVVVLISPTQGGYRVSIQAPKELSINIRDQTNKEKKQRYKRKGLTRYRPARK